MNRAIIITGGSGTMAVAIGALFRDQHFIVLNPGRDRLDVTDEKMVADYMHKCKPQALVNCAGYIQPSNVESTSISEWNKHFAVNVTGAFLCSKYAIINGCGIIINIGSTSAFEGRADWGAYCASKAALISLTETLSEEGIGAFSINPARTNTKMRSRLFPKENKTQLMNPSVIAQCVFDVMRGKFESGSHLIIGKDFYHVVPKRRCLK